MGIGVNGILCCLGPLFGVSSLDNLRAQKQEEYCQRLKMHTPVFGLKQPNSLTEMEESE